MLGSRKIKKSETVQEYFIAMKELSLKGAVESEALFEYIIDGLDGPSSNKIMLYGAKTIPEFKDRLKVYEKVRNNTSEKFDKGGKTKEESTRSFEISRNTSRDSFTPKLNTKEGDKRFVATKCYNCGKQGHSARECDKRALGAKCFNCNKFRHMSSQCVEPRRSRFGMDEQAKVNVVNSQVKNEAMKEVIIDDIKMFALIDTGSPITLIREDAFFKLKSSKNELADSQRVFTGFGNGEAKTLGYLQINVYIDYEDYLLTLHVVPKNAMMENLVIGRDLL